MKTLACLCFGVVTAWAVYAADGNPPAPAGSQVGRFLLCQGTMPMLNQGEKLDGLFRIDTATGQVWRLSPIPLVSNGNTAVIHVWQMVDEPGGEMHRAAMDSLRPKQ